MLQGKEELNNREKTQIRLDTDVNRGGFVLPFTKHDMAHMHFY